jgi:hypothetical protein
LVQGFDPCQRQFRSEDSAMTHRLRFFDDYGSGWLWAEDDATRAAFDAGPLDEVLAARLSAATRALAVHLLDRSAASLNPDYPPDGCPWPLDERLAFDAAADALLLAMGRDLGRDFVISDCRNRLAP